MQIKNIWRTGVATSMLSVASAAFSAEPSTVDSVYSPDRIARMAQAMEHGEGVPRDLTAAYNLYCMAARGGSSEALYALGWMHANGRGTERDDDLARGLLIQAAAAGHEHAAKLLQRISGASDRLPDCVHARMPAAPAVVVAMMPPAPPASIPAEMADPFNYLPADKRKVAELVRDLAKRSGVNPRLALAIVAAESNFDPLAVSPKDARGLMQLIPDTARRFNVKDPHDPRDNIMGGLAYLRWLLSYYQGRVELATAAYNAGEGAVDKYGGVPPFLETQDYVKRIQRYFDAALHPFDPRLVEPSPVVKRPIRIGM